jgi:Putative Actinobacterial Holin-X, holin superfamily III
MAELAVGDIIKGITDDVKLLVRDEVELAKSELVPTAKRAGMGAGLFGAAGYFAICALGILYFAAAFGLVALGLREWLAFLIVGVALLLIAAILGGIGFMLVRKVRGPERTIAQANQTVAEVKGAAQHALAVAKAPEIEGEVVNPRALP